MTGVKSTSVSSGEAMDVSIPALYFPTTTLFLDDSRDFLLNFVLQLDEEVAYKVFDTPQRVLDYIHRKRSALDSVRHFAAIESELLVKALYDPHRFSEVSVMVVDYVMPGMNGLELCRSIEDKNVKKILLTGQADEKMATAAFREGTIHRYLKKNDPNLVTLITRSMRELQREYFNDISAVILEEAPSVLKALLNDPKFAVFFEQACEKHKIIEYYLIDLTGTFLMLDEDARWSVLNPFKDVPKDSVVSMQGQKILSYHRYLEEMDAGELLAV
jgi:CheY-like chemotaxis protein